VLLQQEKTCREHQETQNVKRSVDPHAVVVVIASFNEAGVIGPVVRDIGQTYPNVVVVDDGSSDGTGACALANGAVVLRHPVNLGQGAALQTGMLLDHIARCKMGFVEVPVIISYTRHSRAKGQTLLGAADIASGLVLGKLARGN
jgi:hypothetical protein